MVIRFSLLNIIKHCTHYEATIKLNAFIRLPSTSKYHKERKIKNKQKFNEGECICLFHNTTSFV